VTTRLDAVLGDPSLAWLRTRLRARLGRGAPLSGVLTLAAPTPEQRTSVERLFGRIARGRALHVDLAELSAVLQRAELARDLADAMVQIEGPIENRRVRESEMAGRWRKVTADAINALSESSRWAKWLEETDQTPLLRRLSGGDPDEGRELLLAAVAVLRLLPAGAQPLAEVAATGAGDSHALDAGAPVGTLVLRAVADCSGLTFPADAEERRSAWASVGVLADELSAPVLLLNMPARLIGPTGRALVLAAETGEPYRLSTRQLLRDPPVFALPDRAVVFVCENPSVVAAAADRLGPSSKPLVCTEGQPKTALRLLLSRLRAAGATILYHGDFDWPGIQIANGVISRLGAMPWRLGAMDYLQSSQSSIGGSLLRGPVVSPQWDPELGVAMHERGRAVHEESVLPTLLSDLG
jgi:uncharacterized protein (TIGR02679 family)